MFAIVAARVKAPRIMASNERALQDGYREGSDISNAAPGFGIEGAAIEAFTVERGEYGSPGVGHLMNLGLVRQALAEMNPVCPIFRTVHAIKVHPGQE